MCLQKLTQCDWGVWIYISEVVEDHNIAGDLIQPGSGIDLEFETEGLYHSTSFIVNEGIFAISKK